MKINFLLLLPVCLLLSACVAKPTVFGMPQEQYDRLNAHEKQAVIQQYSEEQEKKPLETSL